MKRLSSDVFLEDSPSPEKSNRYKMDSGQQMESDFLQGQEDHPALMDRSFFMKSSFMRKPMDRGQMATQLVGHEYKGPLHWLLKQTNMSLSGSTHGAAADSATRLHWQRRSPEWPEDQIKAHKVMVAKEVEASTTLQPDEMIRIEYYITQDMRPEDVEQLPDWLWAKVLAKINSKYQHDERLKGLLSWLRQRAEQDWDRGSREALLREALRDPWQRRRLQIHKLPTPFPRLVVSGPAPWRDSFLQHQNFCRTSLMSASKVVLDMHSIWDREIGDGMKILPVDEISEGRPFYLEDLEEKTTSALELARAQIQNYLLLSAEHMWRHQRRWADLVTAEGPSEDLKRLMNSVHSLACRRLREKTYDSSDGLKKLIFSLKENVDASSPVKPIIKFKLDNTTAEVRAAIQQAKVFIATLVLRVHEVTRDLPSVATLMFNPPPGIQRSL